MRSAPISNGRSATGWTSGWTTFATATRFDVSCQGSVPPSIIAFLEADDYEDAVRNAISLGGDANTMAAIAGGIAEAFYGGVPEPIRTRALALLDPPLRATVDAFSARFLSRMQTDPAPSAR